MNRWLLMVGIASTIFFTGCNNETILDSGKDAKVPKKGKQVIVVWHTYSEEETKVFENKIIPMFEKQHPIIDVQPIRQSYNEQLQFTLIGKASSKKAPDIVRMDIAWLPLFSKLKLLYPVSDFEDFNEVKLSLLTGPLESNYYNGKYYGLPLNTNTKVAIYNKNLLNQAGYTEPPATMDELLDLVTDHNYVIGMSGYTAWESLPYFYALGGKLMDSANTTAQGYLNSHESVLAMEKMLKLYKSKNLTPKQNYDPDSWQGVINGPYFMIDEGPWFYSIQSDKMNEIASNTVSAPFPVTNGKGSVLGGENLVITKGAKNPSAAWLFLKWMVSQEPQQLMFQTGLIPTNRDIESGNFIHDYPYYEAYMKGLENAFLRPAVGEWGNIEEVYTKYLRLIYTERIGVTEGLTEAAKEIDHILIEEKGR